MVFALDDELGIRYGRSWADFVLLTVLNEAGGSAPAIEPEQTLHTPTSRLLDLLLHRRGSGWWSALPMAHAQRAWRGRSDQCLRRSSGLTPTPDAPRLDKSRDRPVLRCGVLAEVERQSVDIAPAPSFRWVVAFDDGMARCLKVRMRVAVRRIIAAADMAAVPAQAQMYPLAANLQTVLAAERARQNTADARGVGAGRSHVEVLRVDADIDE